MECKAYPSDVSEDGWTFVAPYLTLMAEEARAVGAEGLGLYATTQAQAAALWGFHARIVTDGQWINHVRRTLGLAINECQILPSPSA